MDGQQETYQQKLFRLKYPLLEYARVLEIVVLQLVIIVQIAQLNINFIANLLDNCFFDPAFIAIPFNDSFVMLISHVR